MNAKLECDCGTLLTGEEAGERVVSARVTCGECGSQYVVTATMISEGVREGSSQPSV